MSDSDHHVLAVVTKMDIYEMPLETFRKHLASMQSKWKKKGWANVKIRGVLNGTLIYEKEKGDDERGQPKIDPVSYTFPVGPDVPPWCSAARCKDVPGHRGRSKHKGKRRGAAGGA